MKSNIILCRGSSCEVNLWLDSGKQKTWNVTLTRALELVDFRNKSIVGFHEFLIARIDNEL